MRQLRSRDMERRKSNSSGKEVNLALPLRPGLSARVCDLYVWSLDWVRPVHS
jgi:hypothetical protein